MTTDTAAGCPPLAGRVAIITGASRGIGRAITAHLCSLGARVVINYASSSTLADQLRIQQEFGTVVHILMKCAGVLNPKYPSLANTTLEDWETTFNVNTKGAFLTCRKAANRLSHGSGGRKVFLSTSMVGGLMPVSTTRNNEEDGTLTDQQRVLSRNNVNVNNVI